MIPPASNTGGKFLEPVAGPGQFSVIDYLSLTCHASALKDVVSEVAQYFDCPDCEKGMFGFRLSKKINVNGQTVGVIAWGGESQRERMMLSLTGAAWAARREQCAALVRCLMGGPYDAHITRADIALDCMEGQYTIDQAVADYRAGLYNAGGRMPTHRCDGDWLDADGDLGRTLYVGKGGNGRMIRVYEKGKQLGVRGSRWVRVELQVRAVDRVIPVDVISNTDAYLAGACLATHQVVELFRRCAPESIPTISTQRCADLRRLTAACRNSYGQLFTAMVDYYGLQSSTVFQLLGRDGHPARLAAMLHDFDEEEPF